MHFSHRVVDIAGGLCYVLGFSWYSDRRVSTECDADAALFFMDDRNASGLGPRVKRYKRVGMV